MAVDAVYFIADAIWSIVTIVAVTVALAYSASLARLFKGGKIQLGYRTLLYSLGVLLIAFVAKLMMDILQINPVTAFGISVRDSGVVVAMILIAVSLRQISRSWRNP